MPLPYQPKFIYRRRKNTPIPTPFGDFIRGSRSGLRGFAGPSYTLGSLSNRPGSDWATPRYVRDEPDMFMAGFGFLDPDVPGGTDLGPPPDDITDIQDDDSGWGTDEQQLMEEGMTPAQLAELEGQTAGMNEEEKTSFLASAVDWIKDHKGDIGGLIQTGIQIAGAVKALTAGGASPGGRSIYAPTGLPTGVPTQVVAVQTARMATAWGTDAEKAVSAKLGYPVTINRITGVITKTSALQKNLPLILIGAAVLGYFLLKKK